jgi:UDP-N-acetylmuramate dehydrogenase
MRTKTIDFQQFSSIKIGKPVEVVLIESFDYPKEHYLIGGANNILLGTNPPPLMILDKKFDYIKVENGVLKIGAATPGGKVVSFCKKNDIAGFEFLSQLPGTIGGIVKMNAGLKEHEIFNNLLSITTKAGQIPKEELSYGYRYTNIRDVVFEVSFALQNGFSQEKIAFFKNMRSNQPKHPSAGSCFKNPQGDFAGRLIEAVGLKGKRIGDVEFSSVHANFLVNLKNGTYNDAITLIELAKKRVYEQFNIDLEREIIIVDQAYI